VLGAAAAPATVGKVSGIFPKPAQGGIRIKRYRTLGRTGWQVSDISMGTGDLTDSALMRRAFDMGVNYVDTGESYVNGASERAIGEALQHIDRDKIFIACKPDLFWSQPTEEVVLNKVRGSLERLRTDYVDAYSLFMPSLEGLSYDGYHSAMARLKAEGRVRFTGVTHHGTQPGLGDSMTDVLCAAAEDGRFDLVLMVYNFLNHDETDRILATCKAHNVATTAMKTAPGLLHHEPFDPDNLSDEQEQYLEQLVGRGFTREEAVARLENNIDGERDLYERTRPFVERYGVQTEDQLRLGSIHWAIQNPDMHTACITFADFDLIDKVIALSGTDLTPVEEEMLQECELALSDQYCRHGCSACAADCPLNVPVSTIMRYAYYYEGQGREKHALTRYAALKGSDAATCRACPAPCDGACPYGIDIPYQMARTQTRSVRCFMLTSFALSSGFRCWRSRTLSYLHRRPRWLIVRCRYRCLQTASSSPRWAPRSSCSGISPFAIWQLMRSAV
jgi:aryl-alcohol dehydrogenase-like predicted oxidoreductase